MAQIKYYQEQGGGAEIWSDILHPSTQIDAVDSPDNVSMKSCPINANNATINNINSVKSATLAHHLRPIFGQIPQRVGLL